MHRGKAYKMSTNTREGDLSEGIGVNGRIILKYLQKLVTKM
jgi:hypothetical protein